MNKEVYREAINKAKTEVSDLSNILEMDVDKSTLLEIQEQVLNLSDRVNKLVAASK